ncbi:hypothetical protein CTI14_04915 [Methylobacterium radiotolerans]|nr:hypothetical protein CTI14_04915 [Methylobacterium radiotolerans]
MIDENRITMLVAREIANTFMSRGLSSEAAEAEIQRTYECFINEESATGTSAEAVDSITSLPKKPYILPILAEWMKQAEEADRQKKESSKP